jgi:hypothetical protein
MVSLCKKIEHFKLTFFRVHVHIHVHALKDFYLKFASALKLVKGALSIVFSAFKIATLHFNVTMPTTALNYLCA